MASLVIVIGPMNEYKMMFARQWNHRHVSKCLSVKLIALGQMLLIHKLRELHDIHQML